MICAHVAALIIVVCMVGLAWPVGSYIARIITDPRDVPYIKPLQWIEGIFARALRGSYLYEMTWREYFFAFLTFHTLGLLALYAMLRWIDIRPTTALNIAVSFVTNTNWQAYVPELQMSAAVQTLGLSVQQFFSAASGIALLCVLGRSFGGEELATVGNFWRDLVRSLVYILLPLSMALAMVLVATGVPQTIQTQYTYTSLEGSVERIPMGMCASQEAIKQLGTNGGGWYQANSAHPLENPTPLSNLIEFLAILFLPVALCRTYGILVGSDKQGYLLVGVMGVLFCMALCLALVGWYYESRWSVQEVPLLQNMGNLEGKECRCGTLWSILWSVATTATANGSVNCSLSSLMPLMGGIPLALMQIGEVVFGGLGTGVISAIAFLLIAVFSAGLMVGRTPEYLGKKIEVQEMKVVTLMAILPAMFALVAIALTISTKAGLDGLSIQGPHGVSEVLYAFASTVGNNGSAFAGLNVSAPWYSVLTTIIMYVGRFWMAALVLALASLIGKKRKVAQSVGTLSTETVAFGLWFCFVIVIIGALNFLPAFTLGPVFEHLQLFHSTSL